MAADGYSTPVPDVQVREPLLLWPDPARRHAALERSAERAAALLHAFVERLDALSADPDLEPVNGAADPRDQRFWIAGDQSEREPDDDLEPSLAGFGSFPGNTSDLEEEFGGLGDRTDQRRWAADHADEGDGNVDAEPSLGSIAWTDQRHWSGGPTGKAANLDREAACEDEGAQCDDEGARDSGLVPTYGLDQTRPLGWGA